ncbi:hypothetical protein Tco_0228715 [Tanacetum coccineum]
MLAPKSANALLAVVVLIVQGRMKLPGSFSLGDVLSNHLLATPTRVRGKYRKRAESFVLNRLATSSTFLICLIAFSVELLEKAENPIVSSVEMESKDAEIKRDRSNQGERRANLTISLLSLLRFPMQCYIMVSLVVSKVDGLKSTDTPTRSSTKELITPFENPENVFRSKRRLFETPSIVESSSPELDLFSDIEEHSEEETTRIMMKTMEQYMSKTHGNYGSGVVRPKINDKTHFELKGQYLKELHENTFSGSEHEDTNEHIKKVLEIVDLFHIPEEVILFYNGLNVPTRQILDFKGAIPTKTAADAKIVIQEMADNSQKWHNRTSSKTKSTKTSNGLAAIQAQLNNLGRKIKKVNEKVYAAQVGCELCKGPHYTKDCPLKEERNTLEYAYYTQFGAPYQPAGQYRSTGLEFYQSNNGNSSYPNQRQTLGESLTKFMDESAKRHEENSNIIKEIRASTDVAIRNQ